MTYSNTSLHSSELSGNLFKSVGQQLGAIRQPIRIGRATARSYPATYSNRSCNSSELSGDLFESVVQQLGAIGQPIRIGRATARSYPATYSNRSCNSSELSSDLFEMVVQQRGAIRRPNQCGRAIDRRRPTTVIQSRRNSWGGRMGGAVEGGKGSAVEDRGSCRIEWPRPARARHSRRGPI